MNDDKIPEDSDYCPECGELLYYGYYPALGVKKRGCDNGHYWTTKAGGERQ